jgi:hypothetical protein
VPPAATVSLVYVSEIRTGFHILFAASFLINVSSCNIVLFGLLITFRCSAASDNERFEVLTDATRAPKRRDVDDPASKSQSTIFRAAYKGGKRWLSSLRLLKIRAFWPSIIARFRWAQPLRR